MVVVDSTDGDGPSSSKRSASWKSIWSGKRSPSRELVLAELESGRNPLERKKQPSFKNTAKRVQSVVGLHLSSQNKAMESINETDCGEGSQSEVEDC